MRYSEARIGLLIVQYNKENASIQGKADACLLPIIDTNAYSAVKQTHCVLHQPGSLYIFPLKPGEQGEPMQT